MRRFIILPLIGAFAAAACSDSAAGTADAKVTPSGQQGQRAFPLAGFDHVMLKGPDDVEIRIGSAFSVLAQGDTGLLQALEVKVERNVLEIGRKDSERGFSWGDDDRDRASVRVVVTMPAIRGAALAGSGDMTVDRVTGDGFEAMLAGSGDMRLNAVALRRADLSIAGSGDLRVAGTADRVELSIAGSGDVDGSALTAKGADVSIAGSGNARLAVEGDASVSIVGSGDADLGPKARCRKSIVGSGEVNCGG